MPSKDTVQFRITKKTVDEIERIRTVIAEELGVDINKVTKIQGEIVLRLKALKGKFKVGINDVYIGKIR